MTQKQKFNKAKRITLNEYGRILEEAVESDISTALLLCEHLGFLPQLWKALNEGNLDDFITILMAHITWAYSIEYEDVVREG